MYKDSVCVGTAKLLIQSVSSKVALRLGNYELINLLLRFGANVNYYCRVNTTHFPSALQYALKDEVKRYHGHGPSGGRLCNL